MLRTIIIDDKVNARDSLTKALNNLCPGVEIAGYGNNVKSGMEAILLHKPDLVLLDIDMPDGTGFDLLRQLKTIDFKIIFITGFQDYAIEAFKFSALDYLLKPVNEQDLVVAIQRAEESIERKNISGNLNVFFENLNTKSKESKKIVLNTSGEIHIINISDIIRCESEINYTWFFLNDGRKIFVSKTLMEYEELFQDYSFIRIHRTHLINADYIESYRKSEGGFVIMRDKITIPVSSRKKNDLLKLLNTL